MIDDVRPPVRPPARPAQKPRRRVKWRRWAFTLLIVLLAVSGALYAHRAYQYRHDVSSLAAVERQVGRHYVLPTNETPVLATVTDSTKLETPFLKQAKNGDKILLYQKNALAIIYRPSIDRIVAVGPVTIDTPPKATPSGGQN